MNRICPNPTRWNDVYKQLEEFSKLNCCTPDLPPKPLILAGWAYSSDLDKLQRWNDTVAWAGKNGCSNLTNRLSDSDFYYGD